MPKTKFSHEAGTLSSTEMNATKMSLLQFWFNTKKIDWSENEIKEITERGPN